MNLNERISKYVAAMPPAISGQGGSVACLAVARALTWGWDLSIEEAMSFMQEYSARCSPPWSDKELLHKLRSAKPGDKPRGYLRDAKDDGARAEPVGPKPAPKREVKREAWADINRAAVMEFVSGVPEIDTGWLRRRSPVDVSNVTSGAFFDAVLDEGERVILFTQYYSQGNFVWWKGRGGFRLSDEPGTPAVPSDLPRTASGGVWWLVQPVSGKWEPGERLRGETVKMTRRSEVNVTRWRHLVLESDELEPELWMKVVVQLKLPIVALYTSGGRSIHALVRYDVPTKAHWDQLKHTVERFVCPLGADPGALSAVRLSRVPGCLREGAEKEIVTADGTKRKRYERYERPRLQELLFLNPEPGFEGILNMREARRG